MTDQDHKNRVATTFEILVISTIGLAALIYDAPRLLIAIAAVWTVLLAVLFGFALGHSARNR